MRTAQPPYAAPRVAPSTYPGLPTGRVLGVRECSHCGAQTAVPVSICPECGEPLQTRHKLIRCRQCGGRGVSSLMLCPHCGRELRAAPPRLLTWGAPAVVVLLFLAVLVTQWDGGNPLNWAGESVKRGMALVGGLGDQMDPDVMIVMTPVVAVAEAGAESAGQVDPAAAAQEPAAVDGAAGSPPAGQPAAAALSTDTPLLEPTATQAGVAATPLPAPTTAGAAATPGITATTPSLSALLPTATPIVTDTAQVAPAAPALPAMTRGGLVAAIVGATQQPSPTATSASTPTGTPSPTAAAAPSETTYKIRPGDTLVVIASRFAVSVDDLMAANNLSANDVFTIQPGQMLVIPSTTGTADASPASTPTATATATITPSPSPSPTRDAPTPAPTPTVGWRLDAPILRSPESGTPISCGAPDSLVWLPVPFVSSTEVYVMHLGYVNGRAADGTEQIMWVLEQPRPSNVTSWDMDGDVLCGLAPQEYGRQWRWYVQVAAQMDGKLTPVSPPSDVWGFAWN